MSRKHLLVAAQGVVTIILLWVLLRTLDLATFRRLFLRLPIWFYGLSLVVVLAGQVLYAWRWQVLLGATGVRPPFSLVVRQYFIGVFLNNFLPSTVGGDLAKVYLLGRDHGYRPVTASIFLDRIVGIGILALGSALLLWPIAEAPRVLAAARLAVTGVAGGALVVLALVAAGTGGLADRVSWLGDRAVGIALRLQRLRLDMAAGLTRPAVMAQAAVSVIVYFLALGGVYRVYLGLQGIPAFSLMTLIGVVMATAVLSNIPISLNGLGLREQLHAVLLLPFGVPREVAVAISLLLFGHLIVASLVGLGFWMHPDVLRGGEARVEV